MLKWFEQIYDKIFKFISENATIHHSHDRRNTAHELVKKKCNEKQKQINLVIDHSSRSDKKQNDN